MSIGNLIKTSLTGWILLLPARTKVHPGIGMNFVPRVLAIWSVLYSI